MSSVGLVKAFSEVDALRNAMGVPELNALAQVCSSLRADAHRSEKWRVKLKDALGPDLFGRLKEPQNFKRLYQGHVASVKRWCAPEGLRQEDLNAAYALDLALHPDVYKNSHPTPIEFLSELPDVPMTAKEKKQLAVHLAAISGVLIGCGVAASFLLQAPVNPAAVLVVAIYFLCLIKAHDFYSKKYSSRNFDLPA